MNRSRASPAEPGRHGGASRSGFFCQEETDGFPSIARSDRLSTAGSRLGAEERLREPQCCRAAANLARLGEEGADDPDQAGERPPPLAGEGRERLLQLRGAGRRALGFEDQAGHQHLRAGVLRVLLEHLADGLLGRLGLPDPGEVKRLAGQQPGVPRLLPHPLIERLHGQLGLAALEEPLGALGDRFDLVAAPLELLTASAGARGVRVHDGHRLPSSRIVLDLLRFTQ